jgi:hypothetical protein
MTKLNIKTMEAAVIAIATLGILFAPDARACGKQPRAAGVAASSLFAPLLEFPRPASLQAQNASSEEQGQEETRSRHDHPAIVGMWIVQFYVKTDVVDVGIEQFYADGNEMTTDIAAAPATDNTCYGVWEHTADRTFKLKHIGWVFDANGTFIGRFDLTATLKVDNDGDTFTGWYKSDIEDTSQNVIPGTSAEGLLKGKRFKID